MTDLAKLVVRLQADSNRLQADLDKAQRKIGSFETRARKSTRAVDQAFARVGRNIAISFGALASVATVRQLVQINDEYTRLEGRLRLVTEGSADLESVQSNLFAVAQRTRTEFTSVADLYIRLAQTSAELGASQQDLLKFTEGVGNALTISGTSAQQASGALIQLSQALGGGIVRAEEFNSILEGAPEIVRTVAKNMDGMGGSIAKLRQEVIKGGVTSEAFFAAFLKGSGDLSERAQSLPVTVGQAFTQLKNAINKAIGEADLSPLSKAITELSKTVSDPEFQQGLAALVSMLGVLANLSFQGIANIGADLGKVGFAVEALTGKKTRVELLTNAIDQLRAASNKPFFERVKQLGFLGASTSAIDGSIAILERQRAAIERITLSDGAKGPTSRNRGTSAINAPIRPAVAPTSGRTGVDPAIKAQEEALKALAKQYEDTFRDGAAVIEQFETPTEEVTRRFEEQKFALEQLAATYPGFAAQAQEALSRAAISAEEQLDALKRNNGEIERSAELAAEGQRVYEETRTAVERWASEIERLTELYKEGAISQDTFNRAVEQANEAYEKVGETITDFERAANESLQGLLADILFDPFSGGLDDMLAQWGQFLQRAAAEAIAAQLMEKMFGTAGIGSGGGILGSIFGGGGGSSLISGIAGLFGGGSSQLFSQMATAGMQTVIPKYATGGSVRGPGTGTSDSILALLSNREFVVKADAATKPGIRPLLESINAGRFSLSSETDSVSETSAESLSRTVAVLDRLRERTHDIRSFSDASRMVDRAHSAMSVVDRYRSEQSATDRDWVRESSISRLAENVTTQIDSFRSRSSSKESTDSLIREATNIVSRSQELVTLLSGGDAPAAQSLPMFAEGGFLKPGQMGIVGERGPEFAFGGRTGMTIEPMVEGGQTIVNHFNIQAPEGRVSRAAEMQIAAAAARGAQRASLRNN